MINTTSELWHAVKATYTLGEVMLTVRVEVIHHYLKTKARRKGRLKNALGVVLNTLTCRFTIIGDDYWQ